jgi:hypothetical protein
MNVFIIIFSLTNELTKHDAIFTLPALDEPCPLGGQNGRVLARLLARPLGSVTEATHPVDRCLLAFTKLKI